MIGIIITGHGHFASGLNSAVELIAGDQKEYHYVDFLQEHSTDELAKNLKLALEALSQLDGIIVLADLPGGSPFKTAVEVSQEFKNVKVLGGANLPMVLETMMGRNFVEDLDALVEMGLNAGRDQVVKFELVRKEQVEESDGI